MTPSTVAGFVAWLCDCSEQAKLDYRIKVERARKSRRAEAGTARR